MNATDTRNNKTKRPRSYDTIVHEYSSWLRKLRRELRRRDLKLPANRGWLMAEFARDRTPSEVADHLDRGAS